MWGFSKLEKNVGADFVQERYRVATLQNLEGLALVNPLRVCMQYATTYDMIPEEQKTNVAM